MNPDWITLTIIFLFAVLYLAAIMPGLRRRPDADLFRHHLYAHRGLHDNHTEQPENSLSAFALAAERGYGIELDVQLTRDGQVVVFHDESLKRACGQPGNVRDYTYEELQNFSLFQSQEKIPLFSDVLQLIGGRIPLIVEIKIHENASKVCTKVNDVLNEYNGSYVIESFHPLALAWYKKNRPKILRGQLSTNFLKSDPGNFRLYYFIAQFLLMNFVGRPDFIAYNHKYRNALSFVLCKKLYRSLSAAWTIRSQEALEDNQDYFDLFIFEGFIPREN